MNPLLLVVVVLAAVTILYSTYVSLRYFTRAGQPPVDVKPKPPRHDAATVAQLKQYFAGKECADCGRVIPPMRVGEPHPGLLNADTHDAMAWEDIPTPNLSAVLETHKPLCPSCVTVETFRRQYPERIVDRHRTITNPGH